MNTKNKKPDFSDRLFQIVDPIFSSIQPLFKYHFYFKIILIPFFVLVGVCFVHDILQVPPLPVFIIGGIVVAFALLWILVQGFREAKTPQSYIVRLLAAALSGLLPGLFLAEHYKLSMALMLTALAALYLLSAAGVIVCQKFCKPAPASSHKTSPNREPPP